MIEILVPARSFNRLEGNTPYAIITQCIFYYFINLDIINTFFYHTHQSSWYVIFFKIGQRPLSDLRKIYSSNIYQRLRD